MGLLAVILVLEIWPMITLIRWRMANARVSLPLPVLQGMGRRLARVSDVQTVLVIAMVVAAVLVARGYGVR